MQTQTYNEILAIINQIEFIIIDKKVFDLYPKIATALKNKKYYLIEDPEKNKNLDDYQKITTYFLNHKISRRSRILSIGGGAVSDLAGFVAATILRGVEWEVIPTSLLAMIDASIGGKVGINTESGKNLLGAFHEPVTIHLYPEFIETLPEHEVKSGQGELLKYTFLSEEIYLEVLSNGYTDTLITKCTNYKKKIIKTDLQENGPRKMLNFGHTFGHAVEKSLGIPHGVAVYFGIKMILEMYSPHLVDDFSKIVQKLEFNFENLPKMDFKKFCHYLSFDKKRNEYGAIEFIIPLGIGELEIRPFDINNVSREIEEHEIFKNYFL
jgi:3-dehydroquinate synthetase